MAFYCSKPPKVALDYYSPKISGQFSTLAEKTHWAFFLP
jgi:hypothetical protein